MQTVKEIYNATKRDSTTGGGVVSVIANLPGNVYKIAVTEGDEVKQNQTLVLLEAMKMETPVAAPSSGRIASIKVKLGDVLEAGQPILTIET